MRNTITTDEFIIQSKLIHGEIYDYSKSKYTKSVTPLTIMCPTHGEFNLSPNKHVSSKRGCPKCGLIRKNKLNTSNTQEFISKAIDIHGNKFDYSESNYISSNIKLKIRCNTCHKYFHQRPNDHLSGNGCNYCADVNSGITRTRSKNTFVDKARSIHNNKYNYDGSHYINSKTCMNILCNMCTETFKQTPASHLMGNGCPKCSIVIRSERQKSTTNKFITKAKDIHGDMYDYSLVEYITAKTPIHIVCKTHGRFEQLPYNHLSGKGCKYCNESKGELRVSKYLNDNNITFVQQHKFNDCKYKRKLLFDFYIPKLNICIEYDGQLHYTPMKSTPKCIQEFNNSIIRDNIKTQYCNDNNIPLLRIPYWEFDNIESILNLYIIKYIDTNMKDLNNS